MAVSIGLLPRSALAALVLAGSPLGAQGAGPSPIRLLGPTAPVENQAGAVQFEVAPGDPAFARIGNPRAEIVDGDSATDRVRVSGLGAEPLWIACRHLVETGDYCSAVRAAREAALRALVEEEQARASAMMRVDESETRARAEAEWRAQFEAAAQERGIPKCPGDPRCP